MSDVAVTDPLSAYHGWGRTTPSLGRTTSLLSSRRVPQSEDYCELFDGANLRGVIPRGLGRSYGDAAQNSGGFVLDTTVGARIRHFDRDSGRLIADAGVSLAQILQLTLPAGWLPPVLPGTSQVTLGGALAADIHGKNHPSAGTFSAHVAEIDLVSPDGGIRTVGPDQRSEIFWATVGGMGLTGVITRVALLLRRVPTAWMLVRDESFADLDRLLAGLAGTRSPYAVAWIDGNASGRHLGRGVLSCADHVRVEQLRAEQRRDPLRYGKRMAIGLPRLGGRGVLRNTAVAGYNRMTYHTARLRGSHRRLQHLTMFFHPLDALSGWPASYGRHGLVQYQFAVPSGAETVLGEALHRLQDARQPPSLVVLKKFGAAGPGHLSFPIPGWTLALDLPAHVDLGPTLDRLDELVAQAGGRVYLAKDARLRPAAVRAMYPRLGEWQSVRDVLDPSSLLVSDLDRRIGLTKRRTAL